MAPDIGTFEYSTTTATSNIYPTDSDVSVFYKRSNQGIDIQGLIASVEVYQLTGIKIHALQSLTDNHFISTTILEKRYLYSKNIFSQWVIYNQKDID